MEYILHIENGILEIKGATKVVSSAPNQAVVEAGAGAILITGNEIEVKSLNLDDGIVCLFGKFSNIKFGNASGKKQPLFKIIFK